MPGNSMHEGESAVVDAVDYQCTHDTWWVSQSENDEGAFLDPEGDEPVCWAQDNDLVRFARETATRYLCR